MKNSKKLKCQDCGMEVWIGVAIIKRCKTHLLCSYCAKEAGILKPSPIGLFCLKTKELKC